MSGVGAQGGSRVGESGGPAADDPARYRVGCIGWSYDDWKGPFYPAGCPPGEFLERYAKVFDFVEVDSSFYRSPPRSMVEGWARRTPPGFLFALKIPRTVTHDDPVAEIPEALDRFRSALMPLDQAGKLGPLLAQFPASFRFPEGKARLTTIFESLPNAGELAVEFRHRSWWGPEPLELVRSRGASLVWSVRPGARAPFETTAPWLYARFVGDRALTEFGRIQRDGRPAMEEMREHFEREAGSARRVLALFNNHFMGFGPGAAQLFREVVGLAPVDLGAAARTGGQHSLEGFGAEPRGG